MSCATVALVTCGMVACGFDAVDLDGKHCDAAGNCSAGYTCDRANDTCVRALSLADGGLLLPDGNVVAPPTPGITAGGSDASASNDGSKSDGAAKPPTNPPMQQGDAGPDGWILEPSGTIQTLNAVAVTSAGVAYAVGAGGTILRRTPSTNWETRDSGTTNELFGVAVSSAGVWVVGAQGYWSFSTDGSSFAPQTYGSSDLHAVGVLGATAYAVGDSTTFVQISSAPAATQISLAALPFTGNFTGIAVMGPDQIDLVGQGQGSLLVHYKGPSTTPSAIMMGGHHYGGASAVTSPPGAWATADSTVVALSDQPLAFDPVSSLTLSAIWAKSAARLYAVGADGIWVREAGTWGKRGTGTTSGLHGVGGSGPYVYAVGEDGVILSEP